MMISRLKGKVVGLQNDLLELETPAGITFLLRVPRTVVLREGDETWLYVHTVFSQSGFELFGFLKREDMSVFKALLEIPGIGPSMALRILSELSISEISEAVRNRNVNVFKRVKGLGTKKAEMIVFALKDTLLPEEDSDENRVFLEAVKTLTALGLKDSEAVNLTKEALKNGLNDLEGVVKYALQNRKV